MPYKSKVFVSYAGKAKPSYKSLERKVNKNTRVLAQREHNQLRVTLNAAPTTTANVASLSTVGQSDDVTGRSGRKIHAESISVSGTIVKAATSSSTGYRCVIFRDNLGSTTAPSLGDLFEDENDFFENKHRLINEMPQKRFTILWDKFIVLNEGFDGQTTLRAFKFYKKLNHNILFTGTAATDEGKNSLWILSGSDEASAVPAVTGDVIFRFSDL